MPRHGHLLVCNMVGYRITLQRVLVGYRITWSEWTIWSSRVDRLLRQRYHCLAAEISVRSAPMMQAVFSSGYLNHQLKPTWSIHIMLTRARCMNLRLSTCGANHHYAQGATTSTKVPAQDCKKVLTATSRLASI